MININPLKFGPLWLLMPSMVTMPNYFIKWLTSCNNSHQKKMENLYGNWLRSVEMSGVIDYRKTGSIQSCNIDIDIVQINGMWSSVLLLRFPGRDIAPSKWLKHYQTCPVQHTSHLSHTKKMLILSSPQIQCEPPWIAKLAITCLVWAYGVI